MNLKNLPAIGLCCIIMIGCGSQKSESETTTTPEPQPVAEAEEPAKPQESEAVGIWDKVSVRETATPDGKWLTSVSLGESLTYLNEEATDKDGKVYFKIRLNDGQEGWVRSEFVAPDAKPAVFTNDSDLYNRADLLTKSDKKFKKMDIVAVKQTQDDWLEITGKRSDGKWIDNGWVKASNISFEDIDIAMAKFAKPAMEAEDGDDKEQKLEEILANVDLSSSVFVPDVKDVLDQLKASKMASTEDVPTEEEPVVTEEESEVTEVENEM